jgi:hypothetical protein
MSRIPYKGSISTGVPKMRDHARLSFLAVASTHAVGGTAAWAQAAGSIPPPEVSLSLGPDGVDVFGGPVAIPPALIDQMANGLGSDHAHHFDHHVGF